MFTTPPNAKTVTVKITRHELVTLMKLCTAYMNAPGDQWDELHYKLRRQLDAHDEKQELLERKEGDRGRF